MIIKKYKDGEKKFIDKICFTQMEKQVFIVNGHNSVGKDTFVTLVSKYVPTWNYSSVDKVKEIAKEIGWDGSKSEKDRKFLSDLKLLCTEYNDMPLNSMKECVNSFYNRCPSKVKFLFLHIREPEEIEKAKKEFNAKTILIKRDSIDQITSNMADANVLNYEYDYVIDNDGTIEDFMIKAKDFVEDYLKLYKKD